MAETSKIEWTDATWNPITGCSVVSPGCTNCYAMKLAGGRLKGHPSRAGLTQPSKAGPVWTGEVRLNEDWLDQPLRWRRPRMIFVCAHGDLFHEAVSDEWIDRIFAVMAHEPQHRFQVLTKRPERMLAYMTGGAGNRMNEGGRPPNQIPWPLPNVWLGTSVEDQERADERIPHLLDTPAAVRFVSAEPLLGPVDLTRLEIVHDMHGGQRGFRAGIRVDALHNKHCESGVTRGIGPLGWVIVGGESGPGARPMNPHWARAIRDQCQAAGVPFFFKQWGEIMPNDDAFAAGIVPSEVHHPWGRMQPQMAVVGKKRAGRLLDGRTWEEMPT